MKLHFFVDIFPWTKGSGDIHPRAYNSAMRNPGIKRYKLTFEVDDPMAPYTEIAASTVELDEPDKV